jgi:hypothetical protein
VAVALGDGSSLRQGWRIGDCCRSCIGRLDPAFNNVGVNSEAAAFLETSGDESWGGMVAQAPIGRFGEPEEIAAAVVWLCSPAASFMVGHAMAVDGGLLAG